VRQKKADVTCLEKNGFPSEPFRAYFNALRVRKGCEVASETAMFSLECMAVVELLPFLLRVLLFVTAWLVTRLIGILLLVASLLTATWAT